MLENYKLEIACMIFIVIIAVVLKRFISKQLDLIKYPYKKKNLLTKTEYSFYKILKEECDRRKYLICPKVRMEDFLNVTCEEKKSKYRGYIKSRHIDFIICDNELHILCGIELDDYSHNSKNAQKVDRFKNKVFEVIGLQLYRIQVGDGNYKAQIQAVFHELEKHTR